MNIGVLTSDGCMYLFVVKKKIEDEDIEQFISNKLEGMSPNDFTWQVIESEQCGSGFLNFRIVEVE
jgi:hypothetical protein